MNKSLLDNMTAEELAHYAGCMPELIKQNDLPHFLESVTEKMMELTDEVSCLESEVERVERKDDLHVIDYQDYVEVMDELGEVLEELRQYCEELPDDHPVWKIWHQLTDVSDMVCDLY